jgi:hypothetical protein
MRKVTRPRVLVAAATLGASLLLALGGAASAADPNGAGTSTPRHDSQIENLGLVKNQIKAYYGDNGNHQPSPDSPYAHDVAAVERQVHDWVEHDSAGDAKPAVVFDVDDTTLSNYNYDATHDFGYDPVTNAQCVAAKCFPAVFGTVDLVKWVTAQHIAVFFITGRPAAQQADTLANLQDQGFPTPTGIFTKVTTAPYPSYLPCAPNCSTTEYKSDTRAHIESMGYHILANVGDQYSDLNGGHADRTFKMPNPMYYLP